MLSAFTGQCDFLKELRQDMIAYRTAKQNVDKILGLEPEEQEQNREQKPVR